MRYALKMTAGAMLNHVSDLNPQRIGQHLDALIDRFKEHLTTDEVLADARKSSSPLHKAFEWDENTAAERFRRKQAKQLMNQLVIATMSGKPTRTRAFVYVSHPEHDGKKVYLNTRSAMARPEFREQVVMAAVNSLQRWLNFYGPTIGQRRRLAPDIERLKAKIQRELMQAVA